MNLEALLPFGLSPEGAITTIAAFAGFGVVCAVWQALLTRDPMAARAKRLRQRRDELQSNWRAARRNETRKKTARSAMHAVAHRLNLLRTKTTGKAAERLASAGWRSRDALVTFMVAKLCLPFVFGASAFVLVYVLDFGHIPPSLRSLVPLMAVGLGAYAPDIFIRNAIQKRQKAIQKGLPDSLDLLIICAEAGLSLDAAMTRVAGEMERSCPQVAEEFGLMAIELGFLPDRRQALMNLTKRCPLPSMRGVVNTLLQTEKYGTPLAKALRVLSAEFRNDRMMKAEEKAARLPAVLTVPMIVFILPVLMIVLVGPAALRIMDAFRSM
jgi:tight adherence protein C